MSSDRARCTNTGSYRCSRKRRAIVDSDNERHQGKEMETVSSDRFKKIELESIKEQYLGGDKKKKKRPMVKPSDKFRFSFDWDYNAEDTSRDFNPLYQNPHEASMIFGRGFRAGIYREYQENKDVQLHWSLKRFEDMTEKDWRIFREDSDITYKLIGSKFEKVEILPKMRNWEESNLSRELRRAVKRVGYDKPTVIQMATIPLGLEQRDIIGIAETGSGKTAAFVLPMLDYVSRKPCVDEENENGPYALVLAPTRELAQQIEAETIKLARNLKVKVVSIVGGRSIEEQAFQIKQGCEVVIATPGRLKDCLDRRYIVLNQCSYIVLDEADRMIDMGFMPQVEQVLKAMMITPFCDEKRTTIMFSATMPPAVEKLARNYLTNPVVVTVGNPGKPSDLISQRVIMVSESEKMNKLRKLLDDLESDDQTAIVFVNSKITANHVSNRLLASGYNVTTMHGDKSQWQREANLKSFKMKECNVLVATYVAGRGIDVPGVSHVINYDMPTELARHQASNVRLGSIPDSPISPVETHLLWVALLPLELPCLVKSAVQSAVAKELRMGASVVRLMKKMLIVICSFWTVTKRFILNLYQWLRLFSVTSLPFTLTMTFLVYMFYTGSSFDPGGTNYYLCRPWTPRLSS